MAKSFLVDPEDVRQRLSTRYRAGHRRWLEGGGDWPLTLPLGAPSEREAREHKALVQAWLAQWQAWRGAGEVVWVERRWPILGTQYVPERIILRDARQIAMWLGQLERWQRAEQRYAVMAERWPRLVGGLAKYFDLLADYSEDDFRKLSAMLEWLESHPNSGLYIRQLPVPGVDTKWLASRRALIAEIFSVIQASADRVVEFYAVTGIRREPTLMRLRLLDSGARQVIGGLGDISAPAEEIAQLSLPLRRIFIVENLQTGLAFTELPGSAVFMGLGYAVELLSLIPWLRQLPCFYWGDLDTHGFAILNRIRCYLPDIHSILMDEAALLDHRDLWGQEDKPVRADLPMLTGAERGLYNNISSHRWAPRLRLEQERIPWIYAWQRLSCIAT
ncbi:MAG: hypothetical protein A2140_00590 [Candidatus Muproteobacteria bacterium RBG_16_62_13]|uniref:Wadjet protein JetD C-terminal domain-containing protein n=1 Tax=Candidatus Muproteobacteria bacterium RBG_16_62_13 TaxID=1817756 RepID=A0A1F6T0T8_9PROT|nr:MAG: hypothetical protein A2140_00590 [Candidatus Muproteobacteria bacterium RBG_16_62_13]